MFKKLCKQFVWILAVLPITVFADTSLCANQPIQSVLAQCHSSADACATIIKYNCLSGNPSTASLQLAQIHESLAQQFAAKVMLGGNVGSAAPVAPKVSQAAVQPTELKTTKEKTKAVAAVKAQKPTSKSKTNYWF